MGLNLTLLSDKVLVSNNNYCYFENRQAVHGKWYVNRQELINITYNICILAAFNTHNGQSCLDAVKSIRVDNNVDCCVAVGNSLGSITISVLTPCKEKRCCCVNSS